MEKLLKRIASKLPAHWQNELKRLHFGHQMRKGRFKTDEKEFDILEKWVSAGDWVLDMVLMLDTTHADYRKLLGPVVE